MEIPDELRWLYTARVEGHDDSYAIEVPDRAVELGDLEAGSTPQVVLLETHTDAGEEPAAEDSHPEPPVEIGDLREVDIESIGEQGDGIARVERGFVVIVPDTQQGERVTVKITEVKRNVAFGEVVERQTHFD